MDFKPMLSATMKTEHIPNLRYPLLVSPKLDGVRCIIWEGVAYSRNAKPIRNRFVQKWASIHHNLDGELVVGSPTEGEVLGRTQSGVMSFDGEPDFTYHLFDAPDRNSSRFEDALFHVQDELGGEDRIACVPHYEVHTATDLRAYELNWLQDGYEGLMARDPNGPYKNGRSTVSEGWLMKLKQFQDGEATVTGIEEGWENQNPLQRDELGRAKRSKDASGRIPSGMLGTILAYSPEWGPLRIAPGIMVHSQRQYYLMHPHELIGKVIHWRSFGYAIKDVPRFARFYGVRHDL